MDKIMENWDRKKFLKFLESAFGYYDFSEFVFEYFGDAESCINPDHPPKIQKIDLIRFCERRGLINKLCAVAREERPEMYRYYFGVVQEDHQKEDKSINYVQLLVKYIQRCMGIVTVFFRKFIKK